jgi:hypothetical protein
MAENRLARGRPCGCRIRLLKRAEGDIRLTFAKRGGVAVDVDHGEMQSATLGLEIESVDQDLSQVGGVDPWNSAAVTS